MREQEKKQEQWQAARDRVLYDLIPRNLNEDELPTDDELREGIRVLLADRATDLAAKDSKAVLGAALRKLLPPRWRKRQGC